MYIGFNSCSWTTIFLKQLSLLNALNTSSSYQLSETLNLLSVQIFVYNKQNSNCNVEIIIFWHFFKSKWIYRWWLISITSQLIERLRVCLWIERSEVQTLDRSNRTQSSQRLATATTFLLNEMCCPGAMTQRWARKLVTRFGVIQRV